TALVAVGSGRSVGGGTGLAISVGGGVSVAGLRKGILRQFAPRIATPATENRMHAPTRQPTIQIVGIPDVDGTGCAAGLTEAGWECTCFGGTVYRMGLEVFSGSLTVSVSARACFQPLTNSSAVAKRSLGSLASALRI